MKSFSKTAQLFVKRSYNIEAGQPGPDMGLGLAGRRYGSDKDYISPEDFMQLQEYYKGKDDTRLPSKTNFQHMESMAPVMSKEDFAERFKEDFSDIPLNRAQFGATLGGLGGLAVGGLLGKALGKYMKWWKPTLVGAGIGALGGAGKGYLAGVERKEELKEEDREQMARLHQMLTGQKTAAVTAQEAHDILSKSIPSQDTMKSMAKAAPQMSLAEFTEKYRQDQPSSEKSKVDMLQAMYPSAMKGLGIGAGGVGTVLTMGGTEIPYINRAMENMVGMAEAGTFPEELVGEIGEQYMKKHKIGPAVIEQGGISFPKFTGKKWPIFLAGAVGAGLGALGKYRMLKKEKEEARESDRRQLEKIYKALQGA